MFPTIAKTMSPETVYAYAVLTDDYNPIHIDPAFAALTPMGRCIAHGMLSLNLIWQWAAPLLDAEERCAAELEIRFTKPVFVGDKITAKGALLEVLPSTGRAHFAVSVLNHHGEAVIAGELRLSARAAARYGALTEQGVALQSITAP